MPELLNNLSNIDVHRSVEKQEIVKKITDHILASEYTLIDVDDRRPWGAFFRLSNNNAGMFIEEFFPGLSQTDARLGGDSVELSPKILLVSPNQRLSWQYHNRRAERWAFLNEGAYVKSADDKEGELQFAGSGDVVQFAAAERHRLIGRATYTLVAEIWQHTDPGRLSDECDIVRLQDDYSRS